MRWLTVRSGSDRFFAGLAGSDPDRLLQFGHEDLAVTDLASIGRFGDRLNDLVQQVVANGDLDLDLGQEVHHVFCATIELGVAFLPTEAFDFGDGYALNANLG